MRDCTIHEAKTKALISCAVTAQLICVFVFAYAKSWSHSIICLISVSKVSKLKPLSPGCVLPGLKPERQGFS